MFPPHLHTRSTTLFHHIYNTSRKKKADNQTDSWPILRHLSFKDVKGKKVLESVKYDVNLTFFTNIKSLAIFTHQFSFWLNTYLHGLLYNSIWFKYVIREPTILPTLCYIQIKHILDFITTWQPLYWHTFVRVAVLKLFGLSTLFTYKIDDPEEVLYV